MKNIHILPTDKPSRFYYNNNDSTYQLCRVEKLSTQLKPNQNIYITSDEKSQKGDYLYNTKLNLVRKFFLEANGVNSLQSEDKKIILTTDPDLIKDGVQAIPDEFLEWLVKNPSCEEAEVRPFKKFDGGDEVEPIYKIIIPKEEPKQETLEEAELKTMLKEATNQTTCASERMGFVKCAKWQAEIMYSEEEALRMLDLFRVYFMLDIKKEDVVKWFEVFKKK